MEYTLFGIAQLLRLKCSFFFTINILWLRRTWCEKDVDSHMSKQKKKKMSICHERWHIYAGSNICRGDVNEESATGLDATLGNRNTSRFWHYSIPFGGFSWIVHRNELKSIESAVEFSFILISSILKLERFRLDIEEKIKFISHQMISMATLSIIFTAKLFKLNGRTRLVTINFFDGIFGSRLSLVQRKRLLKIHSDLIHIESICLLS